MLEKQVSDDDVDFDLGDEEGGGGIVDDGDSGPAVALGVAGGPLSVAEDRVSVDGTQADEHGVGPARKGRRERRDGEGRKGRKAHPVSLLECGMRFQGGGELR